MLPSLAANPEATCVDTAVVVVKKRPISMISEVFWRVPD
jgi:hypothetical protein